MLKIIIFDCKSLLKTGEGIGSGQESAKNLSHIIWMDPYFKLMVLVTDTASPFGAKTLVCDVPASDGLQKSPP